MGVAVCPTCNPGINSCYCVQNWPGLGAGMLAAANVTTRVIGLGLNVNVVALNQTADVGGSGI